MIIIARQMQRTLPTLLLSNRLKLNSVRLPFNTVYNFSNIRNQSTRASNTAKTFPDQFEQNFDSSETNGSNQLESHIQSPKTIQILRAKGITSLFPIQIETFSAVYEGRDVLASDRTGSGKTIAYSLPIIQNFRAEGVFGDNKGRVKFLVLCPTRQLAVQVFKQMSTLKHHPNDFKISVVYGGTSIDRQVSEIRSGCDIIVATPGRLIDLVNQGHIKFDELKATCIDEADQMLEKGFKLDVEQIFQKIRSVNSTKTQNLMFSATIPPWVDHISREYLNNNKKRINLISQSEMQTSKTVKHYAVQCHRNDKVELVKSLIEAYSPDKRTIIFSQTKAGVMQIASQLQKVSFLQGDMSQREREYNLDAFRKNKTKILVATDVASRGLDVDDVGLVIQLEPPRTSEPYIHRSGRTGRAGRQGVSITIYDQGNISDLVQIESDAKIQIKNVSKPNGTVNSYYQWKNKVQDLMSTVNKMDGGLINNRKIEEVYENMIAGSNVQQTIKKLIVAMVGQPPQQRSVINHKAGYVSYVIREASQESTFDKIHALEFVKDNFGQFGLANTHIQNDSLVFDIEARNSTLLEEMLSNMTGSNSFSVKKATIEDKELPSLKKLSRESRTFSNNRSKPRGDYSSIRGGSSQSQSRISNFEEGRQYADLANDGLPKKLFIAGFPPDSTQEHVVQELGDMGIEFSNLRVIKKSEDNIFAFLEVTNSEAARHLIKKGLYINGKSVKVNLSKPM